MGDKTDERLTNEIGPFAVTGTKKPRGKPRSMENRLYNRVLSLMRMPVEHAIGRLKWWRAMTQWPTRRQVRPRRTSHRSSHQPALTRPVTPLQPIIRAPVERAAPAARPGDRQGPAGADQPQPLS